MNNIITHSQAAKLAGVTRQAIASLKLTRSFFTKDGKVDTSHPDWKSYMRQKVAKKKTDNVKQAIRNAKDNPEDFNWLNAKPETIQEEKIYADIIQKKIAIMQDMNLVIERKLVFAVFNEIARSIQSNLVDHGKRISPLISAKLGLPGTEKIIEKLENEEQKRNIENVIFAIQKAIKKL